MCPCGTVNGTPVACHSAISMLTGLARLSCWHYGGVTGMASYGAGREVCWIGKGRGVFLKDIGFRKGTI